METLGYAVVTGAALEGIAYGYTDRRAFAVLAGAMGWGWPWGRGRERRIGSGKIWGWRIVMSVLAVFPLLPVEKGEDLRVMQVQSDLFAKRFVC